MNGTDESPLPWLFLIGVLVLVAGLGLREPWPPDEPRFALIAKDMVESGDWFIPRVGGVLYPDKPPLFFWLTAGFYWLTGSIAVALLLPSLLAGLGVLWLVCDLARRLWNRRVAAWTGAALLATLQFPLQMKSGQIDGLLCFWTTLGLYGFCRHLLLGPDWRWFTLAGAACGLGIITKGVGFLPFLVLIPWLYARLRGWPVRAVDGGVGKWVLAPAALALVVGLWLVPMLLVTTGSGDPELSAYRDNILLKQTVTRYADSWGHLKPPWYLLTNAVPWLWLPLSFLLAWLLSAWMRDLKARNAATLLFGAWVLLVLLFFSISDGKRSVYIFPALPALALLAGPHLPGLLARAGPRRLLFALALTLAALPLAAGLYGLAEPAILAERLATPGAARPLAWSAIVVGVAAMAAALVFGPRRAAAGHGATIALLWLGLSLLLYPRIDATRSGAAIIDAAAGALRPGQVLGFAGWKEQFLLQWNRPAVHFGYRRNDDEGESRNAAAWLAGDPSRRLLLPQRMVAPCFHRPELLALGFAHRRQWLLADRTSVLPGCRTGMDSAAANVVFYDPSRPYAGPGDDIRSARQPRETERSVATSAR
jgi:4-amino-4-deoxy-L-arabinose transferase-like glycosyltransferase